MKSRSEKKLLPALWGSVSCCRAFSLVEAITALAVLALVSSSVLVVINRCMASAADSALRMQAFEVARDNMETLLVRDSVKEMVEYGSSDKYPEIQWQRTVEAFNEPATSEMWIQAVCSAEYFDTAGEKQTIELTHWLTDLTEKQVQQITGERKRLAELERQEQDMEEQEEQEKEEEQETQEEQEEENVEAETPRI